MSFNWGLIADNLPLLLQGALVTVEITAMSVGCGFFIGLLVALANLSKFTVVRLLAKCYVDIIRGTPLLVQIFLIYFALPMITGQRIDPFIAAVTACSINSGAYVSEIFRAGIQSIDKGQMEASRSLGLGYADTMRFVIVPQAIKNVLPALANEFITLVKESSVLSVIGTQEIMFKAGIVVTAVYRPMEPYIAAAVIYLVLTTILSKLVGILEKKLAKSN